MLSFIIIIIIIIISWEEIGARGTLLDGDSYTQWLRRCLFGFLKCPHLLNNIAMVYLLMILCDIMII